MPQLARHFVGGGGTGPTRGAGGAVVSPAAASLQASAELPSSVTASAGRASGRPICSAGRSGKQQAATLACAAAPFPLLSYRDLADAPLPHPPTPLPSSPGPARELPRRGGRSGDGGWRGGLQATRNGIRAGDLRDPEAFAAKLRVLARDGAKRFEGFQYDVEADIEAYKVPPHRIPHNPPTEVAAIRPPCCHTSSRPAKHMRSHPRRRFFLCPLDSFCIAAAMAVRCRCRGPVCRCSHSLCAPATCSIAITIEHATGIAVRRQGIAERVLPMITDTVDYINASYEAGSRILIEVPPPPPPPALTLNPKPRLAPGVATDASGQGRKWDSALTAAMAQSGSGNPVCAP